MRIDKNTKPVGQPAGPAEVRLSSLVNRNVTIGRRRTSLRLEPAMWDALEEICRREEMNQHDLCERIDERRRASSLTAAIRVFIVNYFRAAATEEGHASIGHGALYKTRARASDRLAPILRITDVAALHPVSSIGRAAKAATMTDRPAPGGCGHPSATVFRVSRPPPASARTP